MMDVRFEGMKDKLKNVKKVIVVCSSKGGVGKSTLSYIISCILSEDMVVGVCDFDFTGPSLHILFRTDMSFTESDGINPPEIYKNLFFLSVTFFSKDKPLAIRGSSISDVILELLAITNWDGVETIVIDTPPTITDTILEILKYFHDAEFFVVSSNSILSYSTVLKFISIIVERTGRLPILVMNDISGVGFGNKSNSTFYQELLNYSKRTIFFPYLNNIEEYYGKIEDIRKIESVRKFKRELNFYEKI
ncbi:MAG: P-loop NTPase [Candidatus Calescibacterium sp.]|nr:P-loop NTPase [Candidatus Calescibacterium sp.]MDW8132923.1 P-loop NTPase [Candidatus Calescibacterium sp.]